MLNSHHFIGYPNTQFDPGYRNHMYESAYAHHALARGYQTLDGDYTGRGYDSK